MKPYYPFTSKAILIIALIITNVFITSCNNGSDSSETKKVQASVTNDTIPKANDTTIAFDSIVPFTSANVYSMKIDGKMFYNCFKGSQLMVFTFTRDLTGNYRLNGAYLNGASINTFTLNPGTVKTLTSASFEMRLSLLSKQNILDFLTTLPAGFKLDTANTGDFTVIFDADLDPTQKFVQYTLKVERNSDHVIQSSSTKTNPCPPCTF